MPTTLALDALTDAELLCRFASLVDTDNAYAALMLRHIDEIDRRNLWAKRGHTSMFDFCVTRFNMSEAVAAVRLGAARAARRFPVLFEMVERGEIHLTAIHRLKAHLTDENHAQVLAEARHKTMREVDLLIARLTPAPDVPTSIRALRRGAVPSPHSDALPLATSGRAATIDGVVSPILETRLGANAPMSPLFSAIVVPRAPDPTPLSPRRYKLTLTIDEDTHTALCTLQDLLAHRIPDGDPAAIVAHALRSLVDHTLKRKAALTDEPRSAVPWTKLRRRGIPAHVRREVWKRDEGRCSFVGDDGRRCHETRGVEFAHGRPYARGGEHTVANVSIRCRAHNAYEAVRDYGAAFMAGKRRSSSRASDAVAEYMRLENRSAGTAVRTCRSPRARALPRVARRQTGRAPPANRSDAR